MNSKENSTGAPDHARTRSELESEFTAAAVALLRAAKALDPEIVNGSVSRIVDPGHASNGMPNALLFQRRA